MAIRIDIPGVGNVSVEGAAEERTMREILEVLQERNKAEGIQVKETNEALKELSKNAKDAADDVKDLGRSAETVSKQMGQFGKSLVATAANVAVSFIKAYDTMAEKPIQAGAALLQASIDLSAQFGKLSLDVASKFSKAGAALLGPWAGGVQNGIDAVNKFGKDIIDLGATVATVGNQFLAAEFEKRVQALGEFTKAGASFAGGMTEIGELAQESGIGLANYSKAVANSREAITAMGLSAGEAARLVAKGYRGLNETIGRSKNTLREELLALGYSYEQQGEVMALFMAQQRRAGVALENLAPEDLARGTADYAKNLKVISDITGQDAKRLMERAQVESMRGALAGKLDKQQNEAFQAAFAGLAKVGPEMAPKLQIALTQLLAGKAVRDPAVAGNKFIMDMLRNTAQMVRDGTVTREEAFAQTADRVVQTGELIRSTGQDFKDVYAAYGGSGVPVEMAQMENAFRAVRGEVGQAGEDFVTAGKQASDTSDLTKGYQQATQSLTTFQNKMENLATTALPQYAEVLGKTTEETAKIMGIAIDYLTGKITGLTELGDALMDLKPGDMSRSAGSSKVSVYSAPKNIEEEKQIRQQFDKLSISEKFNLSMFRQGNESDEDFQKRVNAYYGGRNKYAGEKDAGGRIDAGQTAVVGERGPELVAGPGSVLSRATTAQLIEALDAMRELKGIRFGENAFDFQVGMAADRRSLIQERAKAFKGFNYTQLQEELARRPEMDDMRRARENMMAGEDQPLSTNSKELTNAMQEQNSLLRKVIDTLTNGNRINDRILQQGY